MTNTTIRIMVVEDDALVSIYLQQLCIKYGCELVGIAANADAALHIFQDTKPDCILLDFRLRDERDGVDIAEIIKVAEPDTKIIFVTGSNEPETLSRMKSVNPSDILIKPILPDDLYQSLAAVA